MTLGDTFLSFHSWVSALVTSFSSIHKINLRVQESTWSIEHLRKIIALYEKIIFKRNNNKQTNKSTTRDTEGERKAGLSWLLWRTSATSNESVNLALLTFCIHDPTRIYLWLNLLVQPSLLCYLKFFPQPWTDKGSITKTWHYVDAKAKIMRIQTKKTMIYATSTMW